MDIETGDFYLSGRRGAEGIRERRSEQGGGKITAGVTTPELYGRPRKIPGTVMVR